MSGEYRARAVVSAHLIGIHLKVGAVVSADLLATNVTVNEGQVGERAPVRGEASATRAPACGVPRRDMRAEREPFERAEISGCTGRFGAGCA